MIPTHRIFRFVVSSLAARGRSRHPRRCRRCLVDSPEAVKPRAASISAKTCKDCHVKGAKGGEVSPLTKTQAQWRLYFQKGKHAGGTEPLSKFMNDAQLLDVQTFVINHAADSPQPETCGK